MKFTRISGLSSTTGAGAGAGAGARLTTSTGARRRALALLAQRVVGRQFVDLPGVVVVGGVLQLDVISTFRHSSSPVAAWNTGCCSTTSKWLKRDQGPPSHAFEPALSCALGTGR